MHKAISSIAAPPMPLFRILELDGKTQAEVTGPELRERFDRDGVVILPDFLKQSEMIPVRRELDAHFAPIDEKASENNNGVLERSKQFECDVICWDPLTEKNEVVRKFHANRRLAQLTKETLGAKYTAPRSLVMYSVGGGRGQAWHQDCPAVEQLGFNLNRLFYLNDVLLEDGAIVFVPGSHHMGQIPPGGHQDPLKGEIAVSPKAGTLILLHGHVYHRVTPNLNNKPRVSLNFRAFPKGVPKEVTCIGVYRNGLVNFCDQPKYHDGSPAK